MSSQTIRDVLIRVAIEQGNVTLNVDTDEAMKKVEALHSAITSVKGVSGSGSSPLSGNLGDIFGIDLQSSGSGLSSQETDWLAKIAQQPNNPKRSGGGSSKPPKNEWLEAAEKAEQERDASHKKFLSQQVADEKAAQDEYDKIAREGLASYSKIMEERRKAAEQEKAMRREQIEGTKQVAQGFLYLAAASQANSEQMVRGIVQIQGAMKTLEGGFAAGGPVGVAITAMIGGILAYDTIIEHSKSLNKSYWEEMAADSKRAANFVSQSAVLGGQQAQERVANRIDTSSTEHIAGQSVWQRAVEKTIRGVEANPDEYSPGMMGFIRRRETRRRESDDKTQNLRGREEFLGEGIGGLDEARDALEERRATAQQAHDSAIDNQETAEKHARENAGFTWMERLKESAIYQTVTGGGEVYEGGEAPNKGSQDTAAEQARLATIEAIKNAKEKIASINAEDNSIIQQKARLEQELIATQTERLNVTKEQKQAAYEEMKSTRDAARADAINFGSQDFGQQNKGLRLQAKHELIEKQKEENIAAGRDEWEGVAEYTQDELRFGLSSGGIEGKSARAQAARQAKTKGRKFESDEVAEAAKTEHDRLDVPLEAEIKKTEASIKDGSESLKNTAKSAASMTVSVQEMIKDTKEMENKIKELEQLFKSRQQLRW